MSTSSPDSSKPFILWSQVWGLAAFIGAIFLTWLIYNFYLTQLLTGFGFSTQLVTGLLILENAIAVVLEPFIGGFSDRLTQQKGNRFPFIWKSAIVSSILFMTIPFVLTVFDRSEITSWLLPVLSIAWVVSMMVFRAPAVALLRRYAPPEDLPVAASILTLVGGIVNAFRPVADRVVLEFAPFAIFAIGSIALFTSAAVLRFFNQPNSPIDKSDADPRGIIRELGLILGTGAGIGLGSRLLMDTLGKVLQAQLNININWEMVGIGVVIALAAVPAGIIASRIGNSKAMLYGIGASIVLMVSIVFTNATIATFILLIAAFSLIINGGIPFALSVVPPKWSGLGVGMFFAGISLSLALTNLLVPERLLREPVAEAIGGAIAFLLSGLCIAASR